LLDDQLALPVTQADGINRRPRLGQTTFGTVATRYCESKVGCVAHAAWAVEQLMVRIGTRWMAELA
jgi:hypothetical protein